MSGYVGRHRPDTAWSLEPYRDGDWVFSTPRPTTMREAEVARLALEAMFSDAEWRIQPDPQDPPGTESVQRDLDSITTTH